MYGLTRYTAYPEDKVQFDNLYVDYKTKKLKNEMLFRSRGVGLTSFFHGADRGKDYPTVIKLPLFKVEMDKVQFDGYRKARTDEIIRESKKSGRQMGPNTFRPNSRQFCNFGMPPEIDRPISLTKLKQITFSNPRLNSYESLWTAEQNNELDDLFYSLYECDNIDNINIDNDTNDIAEKAIQKIRNSFRNKWASFKDQHARISYLVRLIEKADRIGFYNHIVSRNEEIAILNPDQNKNSVENALSELSGPYKNYLLGDLGKSSQKHKKMHENIESGPGHDGPIFVYSSFRTMEGIEIFSRELDVRGYRKFDPSKDLVVTNSNDNNNDNNSTDIPKLYAILSGAESIELRTQILTFFNHPRNIKGTYLKILLGTSASAQGLSLLNCRQVHIMEPWWTVVLILQVIGRVCRLRSHHALPENERNVYVYEYLSTISKEQSKLLGGEEVSTDEYLYLKAIEKDELNQQFYILLKEIAIDAVISAQENKPLDNNLKINSNYSNSSSSSTSVWKSDYPNYNYMPNITDEIIEYSENTMQLLDKNNNDISNSVTVSKQTIEKKYAAISVSEEKFIVFVDDNNKPIITKKVFNGSRLPIKVIELYDYRSMKFSNTPVLRSYVDETGKQYK